ncbi:MAG: hypothetical protein A2621_04245 [Alphaproteobacteria bacterium RIFCSPHIGHO2_01_FULL_41_14]|nr:MAG: hypothetical protein A3K20_04170 [Alphaproteobacteria bacterium GWA1_45_9]OFW90057.1 MAG: hypothetical protein A2621_04245 [Alphaproteobacteria bacterium RIFCSPHIGHO2_01_FULL_41_14]HCI48569.1 hypothetical protein [Holosporales bacterium]
MSSIKCTFSAGSISKPVYHKTITGVWHVISGEGWFRRKDLKTEAKSCVKVKRGTTLTLPKEAIFQVRAIGD